jgi:hypothetical protein
VKEIIVRAQAFGLVYSAEHEALLSLGASDVHVTSGPSKPTEAAWADSENEAARLRCARAVRHLRFAAAHIEAALKAFGSLAEQPERSPDAVVSESTFNRLTNRLEHERRERELRRK